MVGISRPLLLVALAAALLASACAHRGPGVVRVAISVQTCDRGCRSFQTSFSKDGSSASPAFEWSGDAGNAREPIARALAALPLEAIERCPKDGGATNLDRALVGVHLTDGRNVFCTISARGPVGNATDAERIRAYAQQWGWPIYRVTLGAQYGILVDAIRSNHVRWLDFKRTGCYGSCPAYDARFDRDGSATIVRRERGRTSTLHLRVPFDEVRHALESSHPEALLPGYPHIAQDTPGATITLQLPGHRFTIRGPDSAAWNAPMSQLVARLDQIVEDAAPQAR
ncbi:MAG: hypothetical protein KGN02_06320 [bacterium]|nr:hypothetical protein [bacterium]